MTQKVLSDAQPPAKTDVVGFLARFAPLLGYNDDTRFERNGVLFMRRASTIGGLVFVNRLTWLSGKLTFLNRFTL